MHAIELNYRAGIGRWLQSVRRVSTEYKLAGLVGYVPAAMSILPTSVSMKNLGLVLRQQGKYWEAEKTHRETLFLRQEVLGEKHPYTLARAVGPRPNFRVGEVA